ncbi:MAG: PQQ-dependent sugar dehydrogenase [Chloroflexota bacterium]|nr:PQQ-dependent sugar dehydrogenase [Chloroflexota bacterium]
MRETIVLLALLSLVLGAGCGQATTPSEGTVPTPTHLSTISPTPTPSSVSTPIPPTIPTLAPTPAPTPTQAPQPTAIPSPTPRPNPTATTLPSPPPEPTAHRQAPGATTPTAMPAAGPVAAKEVKVEVVAENPRVPWALAFAPDGRLFFTERPGAIRVMEGGKLLPEPFARLPVAAEAEAGLLGLALSPDFQNNGYVYAYYTYRGVDGRLWNRVVRLKDRGNRGEEPAVLLDGIPGAGIHDGGRLRFGPDGKLYITTGDAASSQLSQDRASLAGKVLRLNPDGSIPPDNPFSGSPVFSLGHRNPQGLAWHPVTGGLFITEHGPQAHDEVNLVQGGKNYGWPLVTGRGGDSNFVAPLWESGSSTWAPSGATFNSGGKLPPEWRGRLFFGALRGGHIHWLELTPPDYREVVKDGVLFQDQYGRIRDVVQGPDGYLYFATSNRDGRGAPAPTDDRILRLVPSP